MTKWTRRTVAAAAVIALGFATACSSTVEPTAPGSDEPQEGPFTIGISNGFVGSEYRTQMISVIEESAAEYQEEGQLEDLVMENADTDVNGQIQQIRNLIAADVDAIIVDPNSGSALDAVFTEATDQGIKVYAIDQAVTAESVTNVGIDQAELGRVNAEWLAEKVGDGGKIVAVNGISGNPANEARWGAAEEVFNEAGVEVLTTADGGWDQAQGQQAMTDLLATYPDIDGVFTQDGMAQGVLRALEAANKQNDIITTGEARVGFMRMWEAQEDSFESIGVVNPPGTGATALHLAMAELNGQEIDPANLTDGHNLILDLEPAITNENFDEAWAEYQDQPDTYVVDSVLSRDEVAALLKSE